MTQATHDPSDEPTVSFDITADELRSKLQAFSCGGPDETRQPTTGDPHEDDIKAPSSAQKESRFFSDVNTSPAKAVLLFYLNSGMFRFEQFNDHSSKHNNKEIDIAQLKKDILEEKLTDEECDSIIKKFYRLHSFTDFTLRACAACGSRDTERVEDPCTERLSHKLASPVLFPLRMTDDESQKHQDFIRSPGATVKIPMDDTWMMKEVNLGKLRSVCPPPSTTHDTSAPPPQYWHLHPELVDEKQDGPEMLLCQTCIHHLTKKKPTRPPLSVASGVDFGLHSRLDLTSPNLHEQMILARTRLYFALLKVSSNSRGQVNHNRDNPARCHAILFPHNSCEVATHMHNPDLIMEGGLLEKNELGKSLNICMVDPRGKTDSMAREVLGMVNLIARPHVIAQWLIVLKWNNQFYGDLNLTGLRSCITGLLDSVCERIIENASSIQNPDDIAEDNKHGSDVAAVSKFEQMDPIIADLHRQTCTESLRHGETFFNDVSFSFVTNDENAYHAGYKDDFRNTALRRLAEADSTMDSDQLPTAETLDDFVFNQEDVDAYLNRFPPTMDHTSARGEFPINDFDKTDKGISTSFPHIFMLGKAYGRCPGQLSVQQRRHLLTQFHMNPSKDRRLLGFLFDIHQRHEVFHGVKAHLKSNRTALKVFHELITSNLARVELKKALDYPYTLTARRTLRKCISHLQFASKEVSYGTLEGASLKHRLLHSTYRHSAPSIFLTSSLDNHGNPRSIRLAMGIKNNQRFPCKFDESSPHGSNGDEFADSMINDQSLLAEGTVALPKSRRAEMAMENPVAFVQEQKSLISDMLSILLGVKIEGKGHYSRSESSSSRKTQHHKLRKGVFGHTFAAPGVTEAHEKGTLHWHFTVFAGLSPVTLQRFAHLPQMCDVTSEVLDSMCVSQLPPDTQAAGILGRFLSSKQNQWRIPDAVAASLKHPEVLPSRKNPIASLSVPIDIVQEPDTIQPHPPVDMSDSDDSFSQQCGQFSDAESSVDCPPSRSAPMTNSAAQDQSIFGCSSSDSSQSDIDDDSTQFSFPSIVCKNKLLRQTCLQGCAMNFHTHNLTCHKGSQGKIGCRLCHPCSNTSQTRPILLSERKPSLVHKQANTNTPVIKKHEDRPRIWEESIPQDPHAEGNRPLHHLIDVLDPALPDTVVVWETKRPVLDIPVLKVDLHQCEDPRSHVLVAVREIFLHVPSHGPLATFWDWLENSATHDQLFELYDHIKIQLPASNGFVAAFNPILSLCTGSHNNVSILGSLDQAKSALFYLMPHQVSFSKQCTTFHTHSLMPSFFFRRAKLNFR